MIQYELDYLIAALVVLGLMGVNYLNQRRMDDLSSRYFVVLYFVGIADVLLDLITSLMLLHGILPLTTKILLSFFYLLQTMVVYLFFCYTQSLRHKSVDKIKKVNRYGFLPIAVMMVMIVLNFQEGFLFGFSEDGTYMKGPLYLLMYIFTLIYAVAVALSTIIHAKEFGVKHIKIVWEFLIIAGVCVGLQAAKGEILLTGFGIALGINVVCFMISNPSGYMDTLTGVFEKPYFESWMSEQLTSNDEVFIVSVDVFRLKQINKVYGNRMGDEILQIISEKLQRFTSSEHIFRLTGNRFVVVMPDLREYEYFRRHAYGLFHKALHVHGEMIDCPAIVCGITQAKALGDSHLILDYIEYLVSLASVNKESTMIQDNDSTMKGFNYENEIERFLNTAVEEDLFEVFYQPIYSLDRGHYVTMEALSRLRHPTLGPVSPDIFIGIAEKNGQISKIGLLQFKRICRFISKHREILEKINSVKINLSPIEILRPGHMEELIEIIHAHGLTPSLFNFEITETIASEYSDNMYKAVELCKQHDIKLALDDFGSGYANLNTVLQLPFSVIKIDKTLLNGICEDSKAARFYKSIVDIMHDMGYDVVAEGVETVDELELLIKFGVNMIQGYYFSKPLDEEDILKEIL